MMISGSSTVGMMPSVSNITKDIVSQKDTDSDLALSLDELGIDEDTFTSLDSDSDGLVTQSEIANAIDSKLSELDQLPSKEQFASLLNGLGLEMPEPPEKPSMLSSSDLASELISSYDTNGDSLLSSEEASVLSSDEFETLDSDGDGSISTEELTSAIDEVAKGGTPPPGGGMGGGAAGGGSSSEDEETYSAMDLNEDGIVTQAEMDEYMGISSLSDSSSDSSTSYEDIKDSLQLLFSTIKSNAQDSDSELNLSDFKNIMKMVNVSSNNNEFNTYIDNLSSNTSTKSSYA